MPPSSPSPSSPPHRAWSRVRRVFAAHPWISDGLLWALPVTWAGVSAVREMTWLEPRATVPMWVWVAITVLTTAPLVLRRVQPLLSSALIAVACCLALLTGLGPTFAIIAVPLTVFSTASWGTRAHARIVLVLGIVGAFALGLWSYTLTLQASLGPDARFAQDQNPQGADGAEYVGIAIIVSLCSAIVLSAWLLGILAHRRRTAVEDIRDRNRLLEKERESESRLAADAERMRIAREMHDIIAHSLSVVIAQADGGRYAAKSSPEAAEAALTTIAQTGRDALAQTRNLLGVLRSDTEADDATRPLPGLMDVPELLTDVRGAGLAVSIDGFEAPTGAGSTTATGTSAAAAVAHRLPDGAGLAVYRIVQEALTNILKHAGSGARAQVTLTTTDSDLIIRILDDGGPASARAAQRAHDPGSGILGMRERAMLYGGTLETGPVPGADRGFRVTARFPLTASDAAPSTAEEPTP